MSLLDPFSLGIRLLVAYPLVFVFLLSYNVTFVGMVLPGDELTVKLSHVGQNNGNKVVKVETFNQRDEKVIDGTTEVQQPPTTYG